MKKLFLVLLVISEAAYSIGVWTPAANISRLESYGGAPVVYGLNLSSNPANCSDLSMTYADPTLPAEATDRLASIVLAAYFANEPIKLKISDTDCYLNRPVYYGVQLDE